MRRGVRDQLGRRVAVLLGAFAMLAGGAATPAAASHPEIAQPFFADVQSACTYAWTEGQLAWKAWHPPDTAGVDVRGTLADRPLEDGCTELINITFAEFRAFIGRTQVDRELVRLEGNPTSFSFTLNALISTPTAPGIDRVVVRACRGFWPDLLAICGTPDIHFPHP